MRVLVSRYRAAAQAGLATLEQQVVDAPAQLAAYVGYWRQCIEDQSAPMCLCALLAGELPVLPESIALEVRAHFRALSAWLAGALERGAKAGTLRFAPPAAVEAEAFMAAIHGAMLSARAYAEPQAFGVISQSLLARLAA